MRRLNLWPPTAADGFLEQFSQNLIAGDRHLADVRFVEPRPMALRE